MSDRLSLRQIKAVIAVCEEGSFTRAAARENATQSGISQHVSTAEKALGVTLFDRSGVRVVATPAGARYYRRCVEAVAALAHAGEEVRAGAGAVAGELRIGLMPTFTRAALAPTLERFMPRYPDVRLHVIEGYSAYLTDMVLGDQLDFAVVPAFEGRTGLKSRLLVRDREMLISGARRGLELLAPLRLCDAPPLKIIVPGPGNIRRRNLDTYFQTHGVAIAQFLEMDAMIGTLELVARSDWVTVLPGLICINDIDGGDFVVNPIVDPPLFAEFVVIAPARRTLTTPARLFLESLETEIAAIQAAWIDAMSKPLPANRKNSRTHSPRVKSPRRKAVRTKRRARSARTTVNRSAAKRRRPRPS